MNAIGSKLTGLAGLAMMVIACASPAAAVPVTTTIAVPIVESVDDCTELNDATLDLVAARLDSGRLSRTAVADVGLRFRGLAIPRGAQINTAYLTLSAAQSANTRARTVVRGVKLGSALPFSATNRPSQAPKTKASVAWAPTSWVAGSAYNSPELKKVIQEIVSQPTWTQGNPLAITWEDGGSTTGAWRSALSHDGGAASGLAPVLSVTFTYDVPDTTAPTVSVVEPASGSVVAGLVQLRAAATDNVGVSRVTFSVGSNVVGSDQNDPYTTNWNTGLYVDGTHVIQAVALDAAGNSAQSTVAVLVDNTAPVISGISATADEMGRATITWATDEPATSRVEYGTTTAYGAFSPVDLSLSTTHRVELTGLAPSTTYHFRVASADSMANTAVSPDGMFATPDTVPPVVALTAPSAGSVLSGDAVVSASAADDLGVARVDFYADAALIGFDASLPFSTVWHTALIPDGPHVLHAVARDAAGNAATSTVTVNSDNTAPAASAVSVAGVSPSSATITWATSEPASSAVEYGTTTSYGTLSPPAGTLRTDHSVVLSGLDPSTTYHFRVRSTDAMGNSAVSEDFTFTTLPLTTTVVVPVDSSTDDCTEVNDATVTLAEGYLEVGRSNGVDATDVGLRFASAQIPAGATITEAHVTFRAYAYGVSAPALTRFRGLADVGLSTFSSTSRPSQTTKTAAGVPWALSAWTPESPYDSPNIASIVQEIVDMPGWTMGGPVGLVWEDDGTSPWNSRLVYSRDWWSGAQNAPVLTVTYINTPDTSPPTASITAPQKGSTVSGLVPVTVGASDDRRVAKVDLLVDGALVGSDAVAPFTFTWDTAGYSAGPHVLRAVAYDPSGNSGLDEGSYTVYRDTVAPVISAVAPGLIGFSSATITWTTDEPSTSRVEYGTTVAYGSASQPDSALATSHSVTLTGLAPSTAYHFRVVSADGSGNAAASDDMTFTTTERVAPNIGPPVASFTFDDTRLDTYTSAYPVLSGFGYSATEFVVTSEVGAAEKLTVSQLRELRDAGWEIASHSADHSIGTSTDVAAYEAAVRTAKEWLDANGFSGGGYASPGGAWNHDIVRIAREYHPYLRVADNAPTHKPYDRYYLSTRWLDGSTTASEVTAWLDQAQSRNEWVIISMHSVGDGGGWSVRPEMLRWVCEELRRRGIAVATVRDVIAGSYPNDMMIDCWNDAVQSPVMPTLEPPSAPSSTAWTEFWEAYFSYPVMEGMSGQTLPLMRFYRSVPNGTYDVYANLYGSGDRAFRYHYSFNDPANPEAMHVDLPQVEGDGERLLGTVTVTDGQFSLYTRRTDAITGSDWYFAWGWIRLCPR